MNGFGASCSRPDDRVGAVDRPKPAARYRADRALFLMGGGPASFRSLHDGAAIGRAQVPPAGPAALSQSDFKKRELLRHHIVCLCCAAQVQVFMKKVLKPQTIGNSFPSPELGFLNEREGCE
jgi:hypothetical protein